MNVAADTVEEQDIDESLDSDGTEDQEIPGDSTDGADEAANDSEEGSDETAEEGGEGEGDGDGDTTDESEVSISFGDEAVAEEEDQSPVIRDIRKANRETVRALRKTETELAAANAKLANLTGGAPAGEESLGAEPSIADADIDYDEVAFKQRWNEWNAKKARIEARDRQRTEQAQAQQKVWNDRLSLVGNADKSLKVSGKEAALENFEDTFSVLQRGIILGVPDDPAVSAQLRYALGRDTAAAKKLAAIQDPAKFTFAIAQLATKMKVTPKKAAPVPERVVKSAVAGAAAVDNQLERLRNEARKSGDYSKVTQYNRAQIEKQRAKK